jgi:hypothetical protein
LLYVAYPPTHFSQEPEEMFEADDYYSMVVQTEEDIYQDLCYIDRQTQKVLFPFDLSYCYCF